MNRVLRFVLAAVLACSALMLTACQGSPSGSNDKKTYKIGVLRIDDSLPLYTAETEKLFAKHGVDVQVIEFSSAADQQKAMEAGELDGMMTDMIVTALLKKAGTDVRDAAKAIPEEQVMTMRSLCGTKWQNFRHLIWPACLPGILTALRTSLGIALALLFITETFAAFSGLGYFIMNRMEVRNYEEMYAAILTLAAIGIIAYMALDIAERKLCPWKK